MTYPTVAHIKDQYLPRSETFVFSLISALSRYHPIVLNRYSQQNPELFPMEHHFSPSERFGRGAGILERAALRWLGYSPYLEHVIRKQGVKVMHAHFGQVGALFAPLAHRHEMPFVTSFYDMAASVFIFRPEWKPIFSKLWNYGTYCVALGPAMAKQLEAGGCPREKIKVVPLAIDLRKFAFVEHKKAPGKPIRVLTVARLIPKKGMDVLVNALKLLQANHRFELWIAGDGPERAQLENLVTELGLEKEVRFLGWQTPAEVSTLMEQVHLFVLASHTDPATGEKEGSPTVLLEAQARGLPVISTYHADIPFIVENNHTGLLVPERDVNALAHALEALFQSPGQRADFGQAGRVLMESQHGMDHVGALIEDIYDLCLDH